MEKLNRYSHARINPQEDTHSEADIEREGAFEIKEPTTERTINIVRNLEIISPEEKKKGTSYYLLGYLFYVTALFPLTFVITLIDEVNTQSMLFANFYERKSYYTTYFSFGKLVFWMLLCITGFTYVVIVNMNNTRRDMFTDGRGTHSSFKKCLIIWFLVFFASPIIFIRDRFDLRTECIHQDAQALKQVNYDQESGIDYENSLRNDYSGTPIEVSQNVQTDVPMKYPESEDTTSNNCHEYSRWEVLRYNYFILLVFFLGLNFTHLDKPPLKGLTLTPSAMKKWPWYQWVIFSFIILGILVNMGAVMVIYHRSGILYYYLEVLIAMIAFLAVGTYLMRKTHAFHLHHYVWSWWFMICLGYQNLYISGLAALNAGIMIEGMSRWGVDPIWVLKSRNN